MLSTVIEANHPRLVRLCAQITGNRDVAEDLAQETLVEALRSMDKLRDPSAARAWLSGIARNVCKRWARRTSQESSRLINLDDTYDDDQLHPLFAQGDMFNLEPQLERAELVEILNKALYLLPPVTQTALVLQFIEERSQRDIAHHLGMSRGAVAMRIQRGKLLLQQAILEHFPEDVETYGLLSSTRGRVDTPLWCPLCGGRRLQGKMNAAQGEFLLHCPDCYSKTGSMWVNTPQLRPGFVSIGEGYRATYWRFLKSLNDYFEHAIARNYAPCLQCGEHVAIHRSLPAGDSWGLDEPYGVHLRCPSCHVLQKMGLRGRLLATPEGQRFQREHSRIRTLPEQVREVEGRPTIVSRFQSLTATEALVVITDLAALNPFQFHRTAK